MTIFFFSLKLTVTLDVWYRSTQTTEKKKVMFSNFTLDDSLLGRCLYHSTVYNWLKTEERLLVACFIGNANPSCSVVQQYSSNGVNIRENYKTYSKVARAQTTRTSERSLAKNNTHTIALYTPPIAKPNDKRNETLIALRVIIQIARLLLLFLHETHLFCRIATELSMWTIDAWNNWRNHPPVASCISEGNKRGKKMLLTTMKCTDFNDDSNFYYRTIW